MLVPLVALLLVHSTAFGKPAHKQALVDYFGPALPKHLNSCLTCHLSAQPPAEGSDMPHNAFGARLKAVKEELKKAGKKTDIPSRLQVIANEDSDGDGVPNLIELLAGHHPGDAKDKPTAAEVTATREKLQAFLASKAGPQWKPFEPVQRPALPVVKNAAWSGNPIDHFIAAEHEKRGLQPRPDAPKHVLLRRVYLDLIGLPPTREEMQAFLADNSADAYEKVVDHLLASPRYGERWGRHWMDVWRYSDWAGFGAEVRESQRHIWHWRDWIVESLNADKPYDRMIQEMLAGDELAPDDPNTVRATGFLARNWYLFNRNVWLDNIIEHTGKAFLGITMNCARCHDHFFDPITQQEYYEFRAIFEPHQVRIDRLPGEPDTAKNGIPRVYDATLNAQTFLFVRGNEANPEKKHPLLPGVPQALGGSGLDIAPVSLSKTAAIPDKRDFVVRETIAAAKNAIPKSKTRATATRRFAPASIVPSYDFHPLMTLVRLTNTQRLLLESQSADLDEQIAHAKLSVLDAVLKVERLEDAGQVNSDAWKQAAMATQEAQRRFALLEAKDSLVFAKLASLSVGGAKLTKIEEEVAKAEADLKAPPSTAYKKRNLQTFPSTTTGRRLGLARWIADKQNPLTARVAVNQMWMRHFGKPIVSTVFDFGKNGQPPSHPALLDWLAAEFMERNWNMKQMHRLMVTSATYRQSSAGDCRLQIANLRLPGSVINGFAICNLQSTICNQVDPENVYLWRYNSRRMEAELVRDSVLHAAGSLDVTLGGPDIDYNQGLTVPRRSIYFRHAYEKHMEFLAVFDAANEGECYRRSESVIPQQALALANSSLAQSQARVLARKLSKETAQPEAFIRLGFEHLLGRQPTAQEQTECARFLVEQASLLGQRQKLSSFTGGGPNTVPPSNDPAMRAQEDLIQVLLNHNEFVTIR
jgi:hypothetical protein